MSAVGARMTDLEVPVGAALPVGPLPTLLDSTRSTSPRDSFRAFKPKIEIADVEAAGPETHDAGNPTALERVSGESEHFGCSVDFRVRNTFIEIGSPAFEGVRQRGANSCPGKHVGLLKRTFATRATVDDISEVDSLTTASGESAEPQHFQQRTKSVLRLVDALGDDLNSMPSTPEPFSIGRCNNAFVHEGMASSTIGLQCGTPEKVSFPACYASPPYPSASWFGEEAAYNHMAHVQVQAQSQQSSTAYVKAGAQVHLGACAEVQGQFTSLPSTTQHGLLSCMAVAPLAPPSIFASRVTTPFSPAPLEPAPGTEELPSIGSADHSSGGCKPCAFLYSKGCENGAMCSFCHLCGPGEKKRRQKDKKLARRGGA